MAIGLNYTHFEYDDGSKLLPNYAYFLNRFVPIVYTDKSSITPSIIDGTLLKYLSDPSNDEAFTDPLIRQIMLEAYPYEVLYKFMQEPITNDNERNQRLIALFDQYFQEDYHQTMQKYCATCDKQTLIARSQQSHSFTYTDREKTIEQYLTFITGILTQSGHAAAAEALLVFSQSHLIITYEEGISGVAWVSGENVHIKVGNSTYVTLYHELTHFVMDFFDEFYPQTKGIRTTGDSTKNNEGFANFIALHFIDHINEGTVGWESCAPYPLFFSMYIDIYATLHEQGSLDPTHNYDLVTREARRLESPTITDDKIDFYYQRFYKYFHYDQHTTFYPKELMYFLGYNQIRENYCALPTVQKSSYLCDYLMGSKHL